MVSKDIKRAFILVVAAALSVLSFFSMLFGGKLHFLINVTSLAASALGFAGVLHKNRDYLLWFQVLLAGLFAWHTVMLCVDMAVKGPVMHEMLVCGLYAAGVVFTHDLRSSTLGA